MIALADIREHHRRNALRLPVHEHRRARHVRLDVDARDRFLELHGIERVVVGLVDRQPPLRGHVALGLEFDDVRTGLHLGDDHHLRQLGCGHADLRGFLRIVRRRRAHVGLAVRDAVDDHLHAGRRGHDGQHRRDALERDRQLHHLPGGNVRRLRDGAVPDLLRRDRIGGDDDAVDADFSGRRRDGEPHLRDGRLHHLVEDGDDARRDVAGEREDRIGLQERDEVGARLGLFAEAELRPRAHLVGAGQAAPRRILRRLAFEDDNRLIERADGVLVVERIEELLGLREQDDRVGRLNLRRRRRP